MNTNSFSDAFPELISSCHELYRTLSILASVIVFAGLLSAAVSGSFGDLSKTIRGLVAASIVVVLIGQFPKVVDLGQNIAYSLVTEIGADPSASHEKFANMIAGPEMADGAQAGFWDVLWSTEGGIGKAILYAVILIVAKFAYALMWLAFLVQNLVVVLGVSLAPVFLAMLTLESTRAVAKRFFLSLVAVASWPVGYAITDVVTKGLLQMAAGHNVYQAAGGSKLEAGTEFLFFIVVLSLWLLVSAVAAPYAIQKLIVHGAQVGGSLLQGFGSAVSQGTSYAIGAGATVSMARGGNAAKIAASAAAGFGGAVAGASGNSASLIPAVIGISAVMQTKPKQPEQDPDEMARKLRAQRS